MKKPPVTTKQAPLAPLERKGEEVRVAQVAHPGLDPPGNSPRLRSHEKRPSSAKQAHLAPLERKGEEVRVAQVALPGRNSTDSSQNDIAKRLTGRDYLSYSSISSYQQCPLKYYFRYVVDQPQETISSNLVFGTAIHAALEAYCRALLDGSGSPSKEMLLAEFDASWKSSANAPVRYGKNETKESLRTRAAVLLEAFLESPCSQIDGAVLAIEESVRGAIIPGCPDILGRVDLVLMDQDSIRIIDFKTSKSRWNSTRIAESAPQMHLYADLLAPIAHVFDKPVKLEWIVLTKTQTPSIDLHTLDYTPQQLTRTRNTFQRVWQSIRSGHFYPCPSTMNCAGCSYYTACRQWDG